MTTMKLIVGLGNPERRYQGTRHNIGFEVVQRIAERHAATDFREKFKGMASEARIGESTALLLMPTTYMNRSGSSVLPARDFYKVASQDILVVCDDFSLPLARIRFRARGSAGGQKGLADILNRLGDNDVPRLRIGIGPVPNRWDAADFVLSKFRRDETEDVDWVVQRAADGAVDWVQYGIQHCMNQYNASSPEN